MFEENLILKSNVFVKLRSVCTSVYGVGFWNGLGDKLSII